MLKNIVCKGCKFFTMGKVLVARNPYYPTMKIPEHVILCSHTRVINAKKGLRKIKYMDKEWRVFERIPRSCNYFTGENVKCIEQYF